MDLSSHQGRDIPIPIATTYVGGGHGQNNGHNIIHDISPLHHLTSNGPPPPPPLSTAITEVHHHSNINYSSKKGGVVVKYKECLKNHAATIGVNATDGCGEFMPSGEEGTLEALRCSACSCHRNFHRKEVEGEEASSCEYFHHFRGREMWNQKVLQISGPDGYSPACSRLIPRPSPHHMIMPLGALPETYEMEARRPLVKKRFRTKFTPEQKEKMLDFAERAGWKLQKEEESVVQQLCQEIGVKRRVLKVWMHNNKHNLAKKDPSVQLE